MGLLLLAVGLFFSSFLFSEQLLFYSDFGLITYPIKSFLSQVYNAGSLPYWNPHLYAGTPFMAAFHPGVFYPPSLLFLLSDVSQALNWFYLFHFIVLSVSVYALVKSWGLSWAAALASALTATLSSFFISSSMLSNFFLSAIWLPLIFILFQEFILRKSRACFVAAILALSCQTLAACPEVSMMTGLLLAAYSVARIPSSEGSLGKPGRVGALLVLLVMALGLSALQLVPTYQLTHLSVREGGLSFEDHAYRSMAWNQLVGLVLPFDFDRYFNGDSSVFRINTFYISIYMGLFATLSLGLAFFYRKNQAVMFWLLVFFVGVFLALGGNNPVYQWIYSWTPFLDLFRFPEKYFLLSVFAMIFLTGYMFDFIIQAGRKREIKINTVVVVVLLLFAMMAATAIYNSDYRPEVSIALLLVFGFGYVLFYFKKLKEGWVRAGLLVMISVDLMASGSQIMPVVDRSFYEDSPVLLKQIEADKGLARIYTGKMADPIYKGFPDEPGIKAGYYAAKEHLYPYWGMINGVGYVNGVSGLGLELRDHKLWQELFLQSSWDRRIRILQRSSVTHWVDGDTPTEFSEGRPVIHPDRLKIPLETLPRAFLVPEFQIKNESELLDTYYDEKFDPLQTVLLNDSVAFEKSDMFEGRVEEVSYRPNHVTVQTSQKGNGFLVLMDSYFPGWTVKVDGEERPVLKANHFYRAVQLGPGDHTLEFDYFPEGFKEGLILSGITLVTGLAGIVLWRKFSPKGLPVADTIN